MDEHQRLMLSRHLKAAARAYDRQVALATDSEVKAIWLWLRDDAYTLADAVLKLYKKES